MAARTFTAGFVHASEENGTRMAGAADDRFDTDRYMLFMQTLEPTAQDVRLGHDQVYVEIDRQGHSGYGGVAGVTLSNERLTLKLTRTAADSMGVED